MSYPNTPGAAYQRGTYLGIVTGIDSQGRTVTTDSSRMYYATCDCGQRHYARRTDGTIINRPNLSAWITDAAAATEN